ncbi:Kae1-associated kinase Bud32 [archaeon]|nr:Kae1-associated kinase Bud32 [archaeon]|tara:strand:+ start:1867 stop:2481 length:615 start_codon:yes stop_codon:yes gene_type:complete
MKNQQKDGIIAQGAEAILTKKGDILEKQRIEKGYRIKQIDDTLRKKRTTLEQRMIRKARRAGVSTPQLEDSENNTTIVMEFIDGRTIRDFNEIPDDISEKIGEHIAKLHRNNIIHGDLTTSNMILSDKDIYFIDFGLSFTSEKVEDQAVDLQLLNQALTSTHSNAEIAWKKVLKAYSLNYNKSTGVLQRLTALDKRGRYKRGKH